MTYCRRSADCAPWSGRPHHLASHQRGSRARRAWGPQAPEGGEAATERSEGGRGERHAPRRLGSARREAPSFPRARRAWGLEFFSPTRAKRVVKPEGGAGLSKPPIPESETPEIPAEPGPLLHGPGHCYTSSGHCYTPSGHCYTRLTRPSSIRMPTSSNASASQCTSRRRLRSAWSARSPATA